MPYSTVDHTGHVARMDHTYWADQENQGNQSDQKSLSVSPSLIENLKQDIENLKRDIADLGYENDKNRASIIKMSGIMSVLQDQYTKMSKSYDNAKLRIVELEDELVALRAINKNMTQKAKSLPPPLPPPLPSPIRESIRRSKGGSHSGSRWQIRDTSPEVRIVPPRVSKIVVKRQCRGR